MKLWTWEWLWEGLWTADDHHGWDMRWVRNQYAFFPKFLTQQCPFGSFFSKMFATFLPYGICGFYQLDSGLSQGSTQIRLRHHSSDEAVFAGMDVCVGSYHALWPPRACWLGPSVGSYVQSYSSFCRCQAVLQKWRKLFPLHDSWPCGWSKWQ